MGSASMTFSRLVNEVGEENFDHLPKPSWRSVPTLFGSAMVRERETSDADYICLGVPFDSTCSSRRGAVFGPPAIRQESLVFSTYIDSLGEHEMLDMRTGETFWYRRPKLVDAGDVHTFPSNPERNFLSVASDTYWISRHAPHAVPLILGGDHSITIATFAGVRKAALERNPNTRIGYIQIDNHFDFGQHSSIHGDLYHGSTARRVSECPGMSPGRMAFVGQAATTRAEQHRGLIRDGYSINSAAEIRRVGVGAIVGMLVARFNECDAVYLSIDIDVLDGAHGPGTGNVTIGGMSATELVDIVVGLKQLPLLAIDICEVAPEYDPAGQTATIAARILFDVLYRATSAQVTRGEDALHGLFQREHPDGPT
jgi:agmatinase